MPLEYKNEHLGADACTGLVLRDAQDASVFYTVSGFGYDAPVPLEDDVAGQKKEPQITSLIANDVEGQAFVTLPALHNFVKDFEPVVDPNVVLPSTVEKPKLEWVGGPNADAEHWAPANEKAVIYSVDQGELQDQQMKFDSELIQEGKFPKGTPGGKKTSEQKRLDEAHAKLEADLASKSEPKKKKAFGSVPNGTKTNYRGTKWKDFGYQNGGDNIPVDEEVGTGHPYQGGIFTRLTELVFGSSGSKTSSDHAPGMMGRWMLNVGPDAKASSASSSADPAKSDVSLSVDFNPRPNSDTASAATGELLEQDHDESQKQNRPWSRGDWLGSDLSHHDMNKRGEGTPTKSGYKNTIRLGGVTFDVMSRDDAIGGTNDANDWMKYELTGSTMGGGSGLSDREVNALFRRADDKVVWQVDAHRVIKPGGDVISDRPIIAYAGRHFLVPRMQPREEPVKEVTPHK